MKKTAVTALVLCMMMLLSCKGHKVAAKQTPVPDDGFAILEHYPSDLLPLYAKQKVTYSLYEADIKDGDPIFGKRYYEVRYLCSAAKEQILAFYGNLLAQKSATLSSDTLFGKISDHPASVCVNSLPDGGLEVTLMLGMDLNAEADKSLKADTAGYEVNPYFSGYTPGIQAFGGKKNTLYSVSYEKSAGSARTQRYILRYASTMSQIDFALAYETAYGKKQGFTRTDTDYSQSLSFSDSGTLYTVYLTKPAKGDAAFLTIICEVQS